MDFYDISFLIVFLAAWYALVRFILPKIGVKT
jgi:hypothetical protein